MSSSAETLFLAWVIMCMARNHLVSGTLLDWKIVPKARLHWYAQTASADRSITRVRSKLSLPINPMGWPP